MKTALIGSRNTLVGVVTTPKKIGGGRLSFAFLNSNYMLYPMWVLAGVEFDSGGGVILIRDVILIKHTSKVAWDLYLKEEVRDLDETTLTNKIDFRKSVKYDKSHALLDLMLMLDARTTIGNNPAGYFMTRKVYSALAKWVTTRPGKVSAWDLMSEHGRLAAAHYTPLRQLERGLAFQDWLFENLPESEITYVDATSL